MSSQDEMGKILNTLEESILVVSQEGLIEFCNNKFLDNFSVFLDQEPSTPQGRMKAE